MPIARVQRTEWLPMTQAVEAQAPSISSYTAF